MKPSKILTSKMSKPTIIPNKIVDLIAELTELWITWMQNHNISNNTSIPLEDRRAGGEKCECLQRRRQEILIELNEEFNAIL